MRCPSCHVEDTRVIDSRVIEDGTSIRRRRSCEKCGFRFTTTEEIEILSLSMVKADGRTEPYDKEKLTRGLKLALRKRPVTPHRLRRTIHDIEQEIQTKAKAERIPSREVGEIVMRHLKKLDKIAYIRFASVYRSFEDVQAFADELEKLKTLRKKKRLKK